MMISEDGAMRRFWRAAKELCSPLRQIVAWPRLFVSLSILLLIVSSTISSPAQRRRPQLLPAARDYFAGKFVLIPRDDRPSSLQQPRMVARVADHDLILPPGRAMGDAEELIEWAKTVDYNEVKGVIVSLDAIEQRVELIEWIRKQAPNIPIYGFASSGLRGEAEIKLFDYLLAGGENKRSDKAAVETEPDAASATLVARLLNQRFGFTPKFLPLYSSARGGASIQRTISERIALAGGAELRSINDATRIASILLFVHSPQTNDQERATLVESLANAINKSYRVALLDLSESKAGKEGLLAELRRRKLLDHVIAYASADLTGGPSAAAQATARVLTHAASLLTAIRFLRDDVDRVGRIDRAHVNLLFKSYLSDWAYALEVRPKLETFVREQLKADPARLGANTERAEEFARRELRALAEELFKDQFKDNAHAILLNNGERAQFVLRFVQTLQLRLPSQKISEAEIQPVVYLVYVGNLQQ
ncbi:MAG: DUF4127 family protein [Blastocatellia bacterium]